MKYRIGVNEIITNNHVIILEVDSDKNIDSILDIAQKEKSLSDVKYSLKENGCKIISVTEDEGIGEIEIDDMDEVKDEEEA